MKLVMRATLLVAGAHAMLHPQPLPPLVELSADRELADHVGFPEQYEVTIGEYGTELLIYAAVISSVVDRRIDPGELNRVARYADLYVPNRYGRRVILGDTAFPVLLEEASSGAYSAELERTETTSIPERALRRADASRDIYTVIAHFDRTAYLVHGVDWEADPVMIDVWSPATGGPAASVVPMKRSSRLPAEIIDRWEFFRVMEER